MIKIMLRKFYLRMGANTQEASSTISGTAMVKASGQLLATKAFGKTISTTESA